MILRPTYIHISWISGAPSNGGANVPYRQPKKVVCFEVVSSVFVTGLQGTCLLLPMFFSHSLPVQVCISAGAPFSRNERNRRAARRVCAYRPVSPGGAMSCRWAFWVAFAAQPPIGSQMPPRGTGPGPTPGPTPGPGGAQEKCIDCRFSKPLRGAMAVGTP
jgi:hypothetical protein